MVTVLHVAQPVDGGVANVVAQLMDDQRARGWRPVAACADQGELPDGLRAKGAQTRVWAASRSPLSGVAREIRSLRSILDEVRPDVVHLHGSKAGLVGRLAVRGRVPTLFQPHLWSFEAEPGPTVRPARAWERLAARWTDAFVCVSDDERTAGSAAGVRGQFVVVPNGIDTETLRPVPQENGRAQIGLAEGPVVTCVARLAPLKGQDMLLDAWPGVLDVVPSARLLLVGDGPMRQTLSEHPIAEHPSVSWIGWSRTATAYMAAADVIAVPSRAEGMALVVLEAMAMGRSIVAFAAGGVEESVGDGGVVLPVGDITGFTEQIVRRLADPSLARAEGSAGRARAETLFDRRVSAGRVADLVTQTLAHRDGHSTPQRTV